MQIPRSIFAIVKKMDMVDFGLSTDDIDPDYYHLHPDYSRKHHNSKEKDLPIKSRDYYQVVFKSFVLLLTTIKECRNRLIEISYKEDQCDVDTQIEIL